MKRHLSIHQNILGLIGETPMIKLNKITSDLDGEFIVKFEGYNPGHSTKDRIALFIIEEAEKQGLLNKIRLYWFIFFAVIRDYKK